MTLVEAQGDDGHPVESGDLPPRLVSSTSRPPPWKCPLPWPSRSGSNVISRLDKREYPGWATRLLLRPDAPRLPAR